LPIDCRFIAHCPSPIIVLAGNFFKLNSNPRFGGKTPREMAGSHILPFDNSPTDVSLSMVVDVDGQGHWSMPRANASISLISEEIRKEEVV
jgi:hypothetical protein